MKKQVALSAMFVLLTANVFSSPLQRKSAVRHEPQADAVADASRQGSDELGRPSDRDDEREVVSTIRFEPFSNTSVVSWVQPHDGEGVLFVETSDSLALVQADRMTDGLFLCTARLADGRRGTATVVRRDRLRASPAKLAAADLTGVELVLAGQDGRVYVADLADTTDVKTIYDGHCRRTERRNVRFHRSLGRDRVDRSTAILGVHAYVTTRLDTGAVELDLRIHNGALAADRTGFCGKVYFDELRLATRGFDLLEGDARIASGRNVFPARAQLVRRFVLERTGSRSERTADFRSAYAETGACYFSTAAYGPDRVLVPRVELELVEHDADELAGTALGPFRTIDVPLGDEPGGKWILPFMGGRRGLDPRPAALRDLRLIADRIEERMPIACFDLTNGEPITSRDFALANGGRQPFQYDGQARKGIQRYDLPGQPKLPSGVLTGDSGFMRQHDQPINRGSCDYEAELLRWDSYDGQHLIRGYTHAAALWHWTGDALSADWIRMVAADAGYDFTLEEVGGVENPYQLRSLRTQLAEVERNPGQGANCDREFSWTSVATVLAFRIDGSDELRERCNGLLRFATTAAMPTGIPWRIRAVGTGGNVVYWTTYGTPEDVDVCGTFQVPMIAFALSCLAEVERDAALKNEALRLIERMAESVLDPTAFTGSVYHADEVGPPMSTWVGMKDGLAFRFARGSGGSNPTNYPLLYALACKASGDARWLARIEDLGRPGPKDPIRMALQGTGFSEAFAGMALSN